MRWYPIIAISALLFLGSLSYAQKAPPVEPRQVLQTESEERQAQFSSAPVRVDGEQLFSVHGIKAFPAKERADGISERIEKLARDHSISPDSIVVVETKDSSHIVSGTYHIMSVVTADAELVGVKRPILAKVFADKIRSAVIKYRLDRTSEKISQDVFRSALATGILIFVLILGMILHHYLQRFVEYRYKSKIRTLAIQTFEIVRAERIWNILRKSLKAVRFIFVLMLVYWYLYYVLNLFPWTRFIAVRLLEFVVIPLRIFGRAVADQVPHLFFLAILFFITRYVLKLIGLFFAEVEKGAITLRGFERDWARPTSNIVRLMVFLFAVVVAYPFIPGSGTTAFKGVSIFLGVIVSLGSSSSISNMIAGYTMIYRRVFKVGDRVKIGEYTGDIIEMRLLVTDLRTTKNEKVIIPNSAILGSSVVNYSSLARQGGLILHTTVTIGYDTPWRQVHAMLLLAAERTTGLLTDPKPFVLQTSLDDFYVSYQLNAHTDRPQEMVTIYSDLHRNIQDSFNEFGVQIMSPHYLGDPAKEKIVPKDQWFTPPAKPTDGTASAE